MNRFVSVVALAVAAFVCACGGGGTAMGGGMDGGVGSTCNTANPGDGGTCTDPPGGASCNAVQNCGPVVQETQVASSAPSAAGGTPVDGTYFLTSRTLYAGTGGATGGLGQFRKST